MTGVQNVDVKSLIQDSSKNLILDLTASTGVEQINIDGVVYGTDIDGVQNANVAISNLQNGSIDLKGIEGKEFTLGLDNVGAKDKAANIKLGADKLESVTVENGDKASFVNLDGTAATKVNTVTANGAGALTANLFKLGALNTVATGAGDDKVTVAVGALTANSKAAIDLGAGQNTLVAKSASASADAGINLTASNLALNGKDDNAKLTGVNTLEIQSVKGDDDTVAEIKGEVNLKGSGLSSLVLDGTLEGTTGVTIKDASQAFTLGLKNAGDKGELELESTDKGLNAVKTESLTLNIEGATTLASLTSTDLKSLTVNADGDTTFTSLVDATKLSSLTLNDVSEDGSTITATVEAANTALRTIDLSGGEDTTVKITASALKLTGAKDVLTVNIGDIGTLNYTANGTPADAVEVFKFTSADFGEVKVTNFTAGATDGDKLDFSGLGITSIDDLKFAFENKTGTEADTKTDVVITAADGQFAGEITLVGIDGADATDTALKAADNFIFA